MLYTTLVVLLSVTAFAERPKWNELDGYTFDKYVDDFSKNYDVSSFSKRKKIFEDNMKTIRQINSDKNGTWKAGVNTFTDMTREEFKNLNKAKVPLVKNFSKFDKVHTAPAADETLPKELDYRNTRPAILTAVKHQGTCGNCWAVSATESMESQYAKLTGLLTVLSFSQITSCTPSCNGCQGGFITQAWDHLKSQAGQKGVPKVHQSLTEEWAYSFPLKDFFSMNHGESTTACQDISKQWSKPSKKYFMELNAVGVKGTGTSDCNSATGTKTAMKTLNEVGPLSVSVDAGAWQWYDHGIMKSSTAWSIDHAVQMVGYGYDSKVKEHYWTIRNSWSTLWGEQGYIRLWRAGPGQKEPCSSGGGICGTCGVLNDVVYPIVYKAKPIPFG